MLEIGKIQQITSEKFGHCRSLPDKWRRRCVASYVHPENTSVGDLLDVFVYLDNENRPVATTLKPYTCVGDFAFLSVKQIK